MPLPQRLKQAVLNNFIHLESLCSSLRYRISSCYFSSDWVSINVPTWEKYLVEFKGRENLCFLEIGSHEGRSAIWFLTHILIHPSSTLICLDHFYYKKVEICFEHNIKTSGFKDKVITIKAKSQQALNFLQTLTYDLIYVDGSHTATDILIDARLSWKLLKQGGMMIFDDYTWGQDQPPEERPKAAIDQFLQEVRSQIMILDIGHQVILRKIT